MENEVITLVNELIDNLSNLCKKDILDKIENEPINWSDLCCYEAKEIGYKNYIIYIGEADNCPYFCDYNKKGHDYTHLKKLHESLIYFTQQSN